MRERGPHAHDDDRRDKDERHRRRQRFESVLEFAFGLHDEPGAAEQGIGHDETDAREETEWTPPGESLVPERPVRFVCLEAELESYAAPDQARQHKEEGDVERAQQYGISEREDSHQ